eukprot:3262309-Heterocapsa_arctica.AAC.1
MDVRAVHHKELPAVRLPGHDGAVELAEIRVVPSQLGNAIEVPVRVVDRLRREPRVSHGRAEDHAANGTVAVDAQPTNPGGRDRRPVLAA